MQADRFRWWGLSLALAALAWGARAEDTAGEAVILLHGLARTPRSMTRMEVALTEAGYRVTSLGYPSTKKTVEELSREHLAPAVEACRKSGPARIHFVCHSLGGIVLRHFLSETALPDVGRIVMLGPPNQGSEVVDELGHTTLFKWINGPAGCQLGTARDSLPNTLPVPDTEIGVIAGTKSINWILSMFIPGPDDGKVSPEHAKIEGMADFAEVPAAHPFLMRDRRVIELTIHFLRHGRFEDEVQDGPQ